VRERASIPNAQSVPAARVVSCTRSKGDQEASHDRILDFSTAVTGTLFFVPTIEFLDALPDPPAGAAE
jgi:hypothetical protein